MRGKHTSIPKELKSFFSWAESVDEITKVIITRTEGCRHSYKPGFIRFRGVVDGGIKMTGYSGNGVTDLFVRCKEENIKELLLKFVKKWSPDERTSILGSTDENRLS